MQYIVWHLMSLMGTKYALGPSIKQLKYGTQSLENCCLLTLAIRAKLLLSRLTRMES